MLTAEQIAERRKGIGASDAPRIIAGDWHSLWMEKTGKVEAEDLSSVWPVQLGSTTEQLNLDWYERKTGQAVTMRGKLIIRDGLPLRCTLDGMAPDGTVIEAKHVNGFSKIEEVVARYTPQVQHQMLVTGQRKAILSVIIGSNEPVLEEVAYDEFWATEYLEQCKLFWGYVERDEPPSQGAPMVIEPVSPEKMRKVDMTGDNEWAAAAADWLANRDASKTFEASAKTIKGKIEPDVCEATGHGIITKRSKAGSLSIKESK